MSLYGLTGTAALQMYRGYEVPFHVVREADIEAVRDRILPFLSGLCGARIIKLWPGSKPTAPICKRCWRMRKSGAR